MIEPVHELDDDASSRLCSRTATTPLTHCGEAGTIYYIREFGLNRFAGTVRALDSDSESRKFYKAVHPEVICTGVRQLWSYFSHEIKGLT